MSNTIRQNMPMLGVIRQHRASEKVRNTAMERISSGLTVNSAKDNVQYDAMAKRLTADLRTNEVGMINIADGVSMLSTREAYLSKLVDFITEIKKCAMRGVNGGADGSQGPVAGDHAVLERQIGMLDGEARGMVSRAFFNGQALFNAAPEEGAPEGAPDLTHVSIQYDDERSFYITPDHPDLHFTDLQDLDDAKFQGIMDEADKFLQNLSMARTQVGIEINILESIDEGLREINLIDTKARSGLIEADISEEFATLSSSNALIAAAQYAMGELKDSQVELVRSLSR